MVATWKRTVKRGAGVMALCVGLVAVLFGHSHEVQAQTWLPAPPAVDCRPPSERFRPNPPQSDQPFTILTSSSAGILLEYYLELVGREIRIYARTRDAGIPQAKRCNEIPIAAGRFSPGQYSYVMWEYGERGTIGQYEPTPLIITRDPSFNIAAPPSAAPVNEPLMLLLLLVALIFHVRKQITFKE